MLKQNKIIFLFIFLASINLAIGQSAKKETVKSTFNKPLADKLDSILIDDQKGRDELQKIAIDGIKDTAAVIALAMKMNQQDAINQAKVEAILDKYGWLGADVVGEDGNDALFFVIQHAGLEIQEKYLPMLRDAVKKGNAKASLLALMEDRVNIGEGKKQVYGSQLDNNSTSGDLEVLPLEDPDNVDKRRAEMGLETMAEYCKNFNLVWDVERYKKGLPLVKMDNAEKK
jgi:hypothetical protein